MSHKEHKSIRAKSIGDDYIDVIITIIFNGKSMPNERRK